MAKLKKGEAPEPEKTLLEFMQRTPPCVVRIMAVNPAVGRRKAYLKPLNQLVKEAGLSRRTVQRLASLKDWGGIKVSVASAFIWACGIDILRKKDMRRFMYQYGDRDFIHLTPIQKKRFFKMMGWDSIVK